MSAVAGVGGVAGPHCKLVRSPYPISEECFPVPECEHRCDVVSWYRTCYFRLLPRCQVSEHVCDIKQRKKCGVVKEKVCRVVQVSCDWWRPGHVTTC